MDTSVIHACTAGALQGTISFPETLRRLSAIGIERYHADLIRMEKVFYGNDDRSLIERLPVENAPAVAETFDAGMVQATIRESQQGRIDYPEFLRRIMAYGAASYTIFIDGGHAVYHGRKGENYVEIFPDRNA